MPKTFSVVTLTFNSERYLEETIQSVILQRGDFYIDYVIIDNCSTDGTLDILKRYQEEVDAGDVRINCHGVRFRFVSEPDAGMYDALRKGMRMCEGDYFSYINSDDFYLPNAFSTVMQVFDDKEINWLTGLPTLYGRDGAVIIANTPCVFRSSYIRSGVYGGLLPHIQQESTFWRRELSDDLDLDQLAGLRYAGDYYIWHHLSKNNELYTVWSQLSGFRKHPGNKSLDEDAYNKEFRSIADNKLTILDYLKILTYKLLFMIFGNRFLKLFSRVIIVR